MRVLLRHTRAVIRLDHVDRSGGERGPERVTLRSVAQRRPHRERVVAGEQRGAIEYERVRGHLRCDFLPALLRERDFVGRLAA